MFAPLEFCSLSVSSFETFNSNKSAGQLAIACTCTSSLNMHMYMWPVIVSAIDQFCRFIYSKHSRKQHCISHFMLRLSCLFALSNAHSQNEIHKPFFVHCIIIQLLPMFYYIIRNERKRKRRRRRVQPVCISNFFTYLQYNPLLNAMPYTYDQIPFHVYCVYLQKPIPRSLRNIHSTM